MINFPMGTVLQLTGEPAVYTPDGGSPVNCYVKRIIAAREQSGVSGSTLIYHLLREDVSAVAAGDTLSVGGETITIETVDPVEGDTENLLWQVSAEWGVLATWTRAAGGGDAQHPPQGETFTVAAATAGAATVSINSPYVVGKIVAGDTFTIDGDATVYSVQSDVEAGFTGFENVSVSPVLAGNVSGEAVTFDFSSADISIRVGVSDYEAQEVFGSVQTGDRRLIIRSDHLTSRTDVQPGDSYNFSGQVWTVQSAKAVYEGANIIAWEAQVRR